MPNRNKKKYKPWKYDSNQKIPKRNIDRWENRISDIEHNIYGEMPTTSKNAELQSKMLSTNKKWKKMSSEMIPIRTIKRWKNRQWQTNEGIPEQDTEDIPQEDTEDISQKKALSSSPEDLTMKIYKNWSRYCSEPVPMSTVKRWKILGDEIHNETESVSSNLQNIIENATEHNSDNYSDDHNELATDDYNEDEDDGDDDDDDDDDDISNENTDDNDYDTDENTGDTDDNNDYDTDASNDDTDDDTETDTGDEMEENEEHVGESPTNVKHLYKNSKLTLNDSVIKIFDLWIDQCLSKTYLKKHLQIMSEMLPEKNSLPKTQYKLFKYIEKQVPLVPIIHHYFCEECLIYLSTSFQNCSKCNGNKILYFFELDFKEQIIQLFELKKLASKLKINSQDNQFINDVTDGTEYIRVNNRENRNMFDLTLILYTDGLSLVKSGKTHCWPLMFTIVELPPSIRHLYIVTFGIWCNKLKPPMNLFLQPFCMKFQKCFYDGIEWINPTNGIKIVSQITAPLIIADAPARAQVQNILNFNGKYGCNLCEIKTKPCAKPGGKRKIRIYPFQRELKLRTINSIKKQANAVNVIKGVKGHSIVSILPMTDISTCVLPEYMHSVLLGVVKQFINIWLNKKGHWQIRCYLEEIDTFLLHIKPTQNFGRHPRSLSCFHNYKATEFFNFLIYYSLPTLQFCLPEIYFQHWILLVISIYILLKPQINVHFDLPKAEMLLKNFVENVKDLYGEHELTYNVHQLLHLVDCVKRWGPLWATSAFMFENENGVLAKIVHGKKNLGQEMLNNLQMVQAVDALKYVSKYEFRGKLSKKFEVLGKHLKYVLNDEEKYIFSSEEISVEEIKIFSRAKINNQVYTSVLYKTTKTNNYTVEIKINKSTFYGRIQFFFTKQEELYFLFQKVRIEVDNYFTNLETESVVEHIIPIKEEHKSCIIKAEIIELNHVIRVGSFICLRPNFYNLEF